MMIYLEKFSLDRANELFLLTDKNRDYLKKTLPWLDNMQTVQDSLAFLERSLQQDAKGETLNFFICNQKNRIILGVIGLRDITLHQAVIGYWLGEEFTQRGYMTQAVTLLIQEAKNRYLEELIIKCAPTNFPSQRVAEKHGFEYDHTEYQVENLYGRLGDLNVFIKYLDYR